MIICDTGPLVAAALANDADHAACVKLFTNLHEAGTQLLVPATVVAEVGYLLAREAGPRVESLFLRSLADGEFSAVDLAATGYARMAELVTTYGSLPLGTTGLGHRPGGEVPAHRGGHARPPALHRGPSQPRDCVDPASVTAWARDGDVVEFRFNV